MLTISLKYRGFVTPFALMMFLTRVNALVSCQIFFLLITFITLAALMRLLTRVAKPVYFQRAFSRKAFMA